MLTVRSSDGRSLNSTLPAQIAERAAQRLEQRLRPVDADAHGVAVVHRLADRAGQRVDGALLHRRRSARRRGCGRRLSW